MVEVLLNILGKISLGVFAGLVGTMTVGYVLGVRGSALWRKLIAYVGNVNVDVDDKREKKTVGV
jgi:hypothetical protein